MDWIGFLFTWALMMTCYFAGLRAGSKSRAPVFSKDRAYVRLERGFNGTVHAKTIGDDVKLILAVCAHLESEGYGMYGVVEALGAAIDNGKVDPTEESEKE